MKRKHTIGISSFAIFEELYLRYYNVDDKKQRMCLSALGSNFSSPSFFKKLHFCASSIFCVIEMKIVVTELEIHIIHFIHFIITFALKLLFIKSRLLY